MIIIYQSWATSFASVDTSQFVLVVDDIKSSSPTITEKALTTYEVLPKFRVY